jgi:uncharacterized paraquat-inducible protein A
MAEIHLECPKCGQPIDAPYQMAAQMIHCPSCKGTIQIPGSSRNTGSLTKCPSCQSDVSTAAAACPKCGHQFKYAGAVNLKDPVHVIGLIVCAVLIISLGLWLLYVMVS